LQHRRRRIELAETAPLPPPADPEPPAAPPSVPVIGVTQQERVERRARRVARWEAVQRLRAAGKSLRQIARETGLNRRTVTRLATPPVPARPPPPEPHPFSGPVSPPLQPFLAYLRERWEAGCRVIAQLFRELVERGYAGSRAMLYRAFRAWRVPR